MESERQELYEPATKCRVYAWPYEQLYFGPIPDFGMVQYSAPVLRLGLYSGFYVRFNKAAWIKCHAIIIPAGVIHEVFPTSGVIAKFWVEKESLHYPFFHRYLHSQIKNTDSQNLEKDLVMVFRRIYENQLSFNEAKRELDKLFCLKTFVKDFTDSRILKISEIIRNELDYDFSIERLAMEVDLSPSRLLHLIKKETGTSYRKFRMWQRLRYAISIFGSTHSLTYAAVEAGFYDASHFTRCFKARYGVVPSVVHKTLGMYEVEQSDT